MINSDWSVQNRLPTVDDIADVIRQGMPGTSMPAFPNLTSQDRNRLAEQVLQYRRAGIRSQLLEIARTEKSEIAEDEIADILQRRTTPDAPQPVPSFEVSNTTSLSRGKEAFVQLGCHNCHRIDQDYSRLSYFSMKTGSRRLHEI